MLEHVQAAPPDPILGLTADYKEDPNPEKVNLGVGVYKDDTGVTPIFPSVKEAEKRLLESEETKSYLPIEGDPEYGKFVRELLFGSGHEWVEGGRAVSLHTPGGTGALRLAGDFLVKILPDTKIWLSDPTWANHNKVFSAAGLSAESYPYYDATGKSLDFDKMCEALKTVPEGDIVLLHGCCHNPTGQDPTEKQWKEIAAILARRKAVPFLDFAYQGLGDGLEADATGLRALAEVCPEMLIASSFSKNFGLYCERVGALTCVALDTDTAKAALSQLKICARTNYSNPPAHGAMIVKTILSDKMLREQWEEEAKGVRDRINKMRDLFVETLKQKGVEEDFSFIKQQKGMFSYSGLSKAQVETLREKNSIYIVGSGRINVAGMTTGNMDFICEAIKSVL
ncbi:MAG: aromatic amino acid transaminase [Candidatus Sumerlaeota bacterium]